MTVVAVLGTALTTMAQLTMDVNTKKQAVGLQIEATGIAINSALGFRVVLK